MRIYDAKNLKRYDKLADKRRKVFVLKALFFTGLIIAMAGLILYLLFFSGVLDITEISVSGLDKVNDDAFNTELNSRLNSMWLGVIGFQRNVVFFNSGDFKAEVLAAFPEIKEITTDKEPPHSLNINATERETAGIWCFTSGCKYFDKEGNIWGEAARSSGFLILIVDDLRPDSQKIDTGLLEHIILISERLKAKNILLNKFAIPDAFIGDFNAFTSGGYELLFSVDSDIKGQLEVLDIFLAEKTNDPDFKPQYIDLRISSRIYYK